MARGIDNDTHIPRDLVIADVDLRNAIASVTGAVPDTPRMIATGCGKRRAISSTSRQWQSVTCPVCRAYGHQQYNQWSQSMAAAAELPNATSEQTKEWRRLAAQYRVLAVLFRDDDNEVE